jgi:hypothetical protein
MRRMAAYAILMTSLLGGLLAAPATAAMAQVAPDGPPFGCCDR